MACAVVVVVALAVAGAAPWMFAAIVVVAALAALDAIRRSRREFAGAAPAPLPAGDTRARIVVERTPAGRSDRLRSYRVLVDGGTAGSLVPGETVEAPVEPGRHVVQVRIDWCRSQAVTVSVHEGERARLTARPRPASQALFWIILGWRRYPILEAADTLRDPRGRGSADNAGL